MAESTTVSGRRRSRALFVIIVSQLLGTTLWFGANSAAHSLMAEWNLRVEDIGLLTVAVQLGFISGTLFLALTSLADRYRASVVFAVSAVAGAFANLAFAWLAGGFVTGVALRFATGFCLAGIYPIGMKLVVGWVPRQAGLYLGWLVGMLTIGTGLPHLIRAVAPDWPWHEVVSVASALAMIAAGAVLWVGEGPGIRSQVVTPLDFGAAFGAFKNVGFRAAAAGYFGHMWELYAFWTLVPFLLASVLHKTLESAPSSISVLSFCVIATGGVSCIVGGKLSARFGSRVVAAASLAMSGILCLVFPLCASFAPVGLAALFVWGLVVIPDSAQFSALSTNAIPPAIIGSALALQNSIGFLISSLSIWLTSGNIDAFGAYVTWLLLPGPLLGLMAATAFWRRAP
ncbi:MAG: MFS transporter [Proteobacteria bacterium]|nr:MFS transporter [Pseudomonadota bacterium]